MLYGGRNSLLIATASAALCCFLATVIALIAGFFGGITDGILSRLLDIIWAFPVFLLAISISTIALSGGLHLGFTTLQAGSLWIPILILGLVFVPYVARPIRGRCSRCARRSSSRPRSARCERPPPDLRRGAAERRHDGDRVLPADARALHAARSRRSRSSRSASSRPTRAGARSSTTARACSTHGPGSRSRRASQSSATVLCLNVLGDGVRDALDPRAKLRVGRQAGGETPPDAALDVTLG